MVAMGWTRGMISVACRVLSLLGEYRRLGESRRLGVNPVAVLTGGGPSPSTSSGLGECLKTCGRRPGLSSVVGVLELAVGCL